MTEWWTYRLSDFLMFSARTYRRLFELHNADLWPLPVIAGIGGALALVVAWRRRHLSARATSMALTVLAAAWLWVAWAFQLQRYAAINTAGPWFAAAFALEALLLVAAGLASLRSSSEPPASGRRWGLGLFAFAVLAYPWLGLLFGRPLSQAEVFGIAPDPTALGTLGVLLLTSQPGDAIVARRALALAWPIPLLWCAVSGATLWAMEAPEAPLLPVLAAIAVTVAVRSSRANRAA
jgi:hypothetical protein